MSETSAGPRPAASPGPNWRYWQAAEAPDPDIRPELYAQVPLRRVVAYVIDVVLIAGLVALAWFAGVLLGIASFGLLFPLIGPVLVTIPLAYHTWFIGGPHSATPGMRLLGVEVRTWDGRRPGFIQAAVQTAVFYLTAVGTSWLVLLVALFNRRRRCLHDFICGTVVIRAVPSSIAT